MSLINIANQRLISQQIAGTNCKTVKEIVGFMGAIQAQDYAMSKWAIGVRLPNSTVQTIQTSINNAEIIRTHLLRPTWHYVSSDDIYWMLDLTAPHIQSSMKSRHKQLELTESVLSKCYAILEKELIDNNNLTREEIMLHFSNIGIQNEDNRLSHLLFCAELEGLICSGIIKNNKHSYSLLEERVKKPKPISREEALAKLAKKYFTSHGLATLQDFIWWSGLPVKEARKALEIVKADFVLEKINDEIFYFDSSAYSKQDTPTSVYLLPAFDEYLIGYKNRSAVIAADKISKSISNNGLFRPIIVVDGQVEGLWKRTMKSKSISIEYDMFSSLDKNQQTELEKASLRFKEFHEKN